MTGPLASLAFYPQKLDQFVRENFDLVQQDHAICRIDRDERTVRRWVEDGTFPKPLAFGWGRRFWRECELEVMIDAVRRDACRVEREELTRALHAKRWGVCSWVFAQCVAVRADTARWLSGEQDVPAPSDGVPLKTLCVLPGEPKRFSLYSIPVVPARAHNLIAQRSFPVRHGKDGHGRILIHPLDVLMCHVYVALR